MKILVCHNFYRRSSGEDRSVAMDIKLLKNRGHTVIEYTAESEVLESATTFNKFATGLRLIYSPKQSQEIEELVTKENPDVVHVHNVFPLLTPSIYIGLEKTNRPVVQAIRNYRFLCPNGLFYTHGEVCRRCVEGSLMNAIRYRCLQDSLVQSALYAVSIHVHRSLGTIPNKLGILAALSPFVASQLETYFDGLKDIRVLPNYVDVSQFRLGELDGGYVAYMGRLSPEKGVLKVVKAMRKLPEINLKIIGTGPSEDAIRAFIQKHNLRNVELLGYIGGLKRFEILRRARCLIVPSQWHEPFGRVVLEAYACGVPIIASRMGGLQSLVFENETGLLFEPNDIEKITKHIRYMVNNSKVAAEMGRKGRHLVENEYSPDAHYQQLMEIYRDALKPEG